MGKLFLLVDVFSVWCWYLVDLDLGFCSMGYWLRMVCLGLFD